MMNDFSLIEKIEILMKLISSSSLFLIFSIIGIVLLILLILLIILNKKINKYILIAICVVASLLLLVNYGSILIKMIDVIIDYIFMALYFPSLPVYISVVLISNISFIISISIKRTTKIQKITNAINFALLDFIFVLLISFVNKYNINIYEEINLFTNPTLLALLELSTGIFVSWILVNLFISAHNKLKKYDKKEYPDIPEIIFD